MKYITNKLNVAEKFYVYNSLKCKLFFTGLTRSFEEIGRSVQTLNGSAAAMDGRISALENTLNAMAALPREAPPPAITNYRT